MRAAREASRWSSPVSAVIIRWVFRLMMAGRGLRSLSRRLRRLIRSWCAGCWLRLRRGGGGRWRVTRLWRCSRVPVLGEAERRQVLSQWNDTSAEVAPVTLAGLVAGQVAAVPDAVAVVCGDVSVSYAGLDAAAGRLGGGLGGPGGRAG